MWALRVLSGANAGAVFPLKMGRNLVGRSLQADVQVSSSGISKEHCEVHVYKDKILIVDLRSSNGTYLNGIKIQNGILRLGDKVGLHDVMIDIVPAPDKSVARTASAAPQVAVMPQRPPMTPPPQQMYAQSAPHFQGSAAPNYQYGEAPQAAPAPAPPLVQLSPLQQLEDYIERVALPGVYKLAEVVEFRMVLGMFILIFIFATTLLSMVPMVQISRASISKESMRRAQSLARNLAQVNQQALIKGSYSALSTNMVEMEDGVKRAMIVQQSDGVILAPASQAGNSPDLPFVVSARRESKAQVQEIDGNTIGASFPIGMYDPNTGDPVVKAHAIILYDTASLAFDDGRVLSLFFQTLIIASLLGMTVFFFMYKLVEYPIVSLNKQLDQALRDRSDRLETKLMFPALSALTGNVSSLLTRYLNGDNGKSGGGGVGGREGEALNLVQMMGFPCVAIRADSTIITCNVPFETFARSSVSGMENRDLSAINESALRQNIEHLISKALSVPQSIHSDQLDFNGQPCSLHCQAFSTDDQIEYFLISITPAEGGGE